LSVKHRVLFEIIIGGFSPRWPFGPIARIGVLTYMSIRDEVHARCAADDGRLVLVEPLLPVAHARVIYVTRELDEALAAGAEAEEGSTAHRIGLLQTDLDWFIAGELITVGYGKEDHCRMKPLDPQDEEVWEIRSRDPKPSIRVFGRFSEPDVFIATHMAWRSELGAWGSQEWATEIRRCKAAWRQLFPTYPPHSGVNVHDYVTENVVAVGDIP
jgi:hypothetical protein